MPAANKKFFHRLLPASSKNVFTRRVLRREVDLLFFWFSASLKDIILSTLPAAVHAHTCEQTEALC